MSIPLALEDEVLDLLLAHPGLADGFSVTLTEAFGHDVALPSVMEQIRGRAKRCEVDLMLPRSGVDEVLRELRRACPNPSIHYRVTAIEQQGRLA